MVRCITASTKTEIFRQTFGPSDMHPATVAVTNKTIRPVLEGDKVFALCLITEYGNPEVLQDFYWLGPDGRRASDGLLLIDNVTRQDNGTYICVAENKYYDNSTGRGNVSYDVIVNYVPLVRIEDSSYGKVIEGDVYLASCIVDANPEADIVWSDPYDDIVNISQTLVITNSAISDAGTYTCHANNTYFNGQIGYGNSSIFVDVQYSPEIDHFNETIVVIEDRNFTIICSADANPLPNVTWKNDTDCLSNGEMLTCVQVQRQQSGVYICEASNRFWNGVTAASSKSFQLIVQYPATVAVTNKTIRPVLEGDKVFALCLITGYGNPEVLQDFYWLGPDGRRASDGLLLIDNVTRQDNGTYICVAENKYYDNSTGRGNVSYDVIVNCK
ncbi:limbic system-associated membrane protein-like [Ptychodera flava]|uniref:limbic system-associated membrane protein-like n=1 Tax=Ptychodera flava TaxID=63121 RepID=UPI00396A0D27